MDEFDAFFDESEEPEDILKSASRLTIEVGDALKTHRSPQDLAHIAEALSLLAQVVDSTNLRLMIRE